MPGAEAATVLPFTSLMAAMLLRTAMPSAPYDLSIWNSCVVGTPLAFHTIQVSTVVAAHWISPEAMARCRLAWGIFLRVTSRPFFAKMPASLASVSGAKPVQPDSPMATLVPWATAGVAMIDAASAAATILSVMFGSIPENLHNSCQHAAPGESKYVSPGMRPHSTSASRGTTPARARLRGEQAMQSAKPFPRAQASNWTAMKKGRPAGSGPSHSTPAFLRRRITRRRRRAPGPPPRPRSSAAREAAARLPPALRRVRSGGRSAHQEIRAHHDGPAAGPC